MCRAGGAEEETEFRATSLGTLVQMVANGLGLTLLPALSVPVEVNEGSPVVTLPFGRPPPGRTIGLAWRKSSARTEEFRELGRFLHPRRLG